MKKIIFAILFMPFYLFATVNVTVSILPEVYFVKKIAGDLVKVNVMVLPGNEPATYEPKPKQLINLSRSKLYFAIGVPFEKNWLPRFKELTPQMSIVDTSKGIKKRYMQRFYSFDKKLRRETKRNRAFDPHIWLSPKLVKTIAKNIEKSLEKVDPKNSKIYQNNLKDFLQEISAIQGYGHKKLDKLMKREFLVFHPVWGYFGDEFNLRQIPVQIEGKEPKPRTLVKLINYAKKEGIKVIFVQPEFFKKSALVIAKNIGAKVVALDPLEKNWKKEILKAIDTFSKSLER